MNQTLFRICFIIVLLCGLYIAGINLMIGNTSSMLLGLVMSLVAILGLFVKRKPVNK
jgi:hypothetical protein